MSFDAFLKIDGAQGDSTDAKHAHEIEVLAFSWSLTRPGSTPVSQDFHFTVRPGSATPLLQKMVADGAMIKTAVFSVRRTGADRDYLKYEFMSGRLNGLGIEGDKLAMGEASEDVVHDVSLLATSANVRCTYTKPDGSTVKSY